MQQMNLVVNWSCLTLADYVPDVVKAIAPWEVTITYISVPCSENAAEAAIVRVYVTLNDGSGRNAVLAYAPLDGVTWVVARTVPFEGESVCRPDRRHDAVRHDGSAAQITGGVG